jgi:predicted signal transduction protein with EAL and GGDEF domain
VGLPCAGDGPTRITGSFGVAAYRDGESLENLIQRVDAAMYRAKESGKNRVVTAGDAGKSVAASSAPARSRETGSARRY